MPQLYLRFGLPSLRPFPAALQPWIQGAAQSNEFHAVLLAPLLLQAPQLWVGVVPLALQALYPTLDALRARVGGHPLWHLYGAPAQAALEAGKPAVLRFCATTEITVCGAAGLRISWTLVADCTWAPPWACLSSFLLLLTRGLWPPTLPAPAPQMGFQMAVGVLQTGLRGAMLAYV